MPFRRLRFAVLPLAALTLTVETAYYLAFGIWLAVVEPVNRTVAAAAARDPASLPQLWTTLRIRWEYGHAAGFIVELIGLALLLWSVLLRNGAEHAA